MAYTVSFTFPQCEAQAQEVSIEYLGRNRDYIHEFSVTSLSQEGKRWIVELRLSKHFNEYPKGSLTPEDLIKKRLIRFYSNEPGFRYWSAQYLNTINSTSLYASFIPPKVHDKAVYCLHTELSVLQLICLGYPLSTDKKFHAVWKDDLQKFDIDEFQNS